MYLGKLCHTCQNTRIPTERIVMERGVKYVISTCPVCKAQDIDRAADLPTSHLWNGDHFIEQYNTYPPPRDRNYYKEDE